MPKPNPCPACIICDFCQGVGTWKLHDKDQPRDCYGCDGSGISERCEEHKEKEHAP